MIPVRRLNHAVLYIRDVDRSVAFYREAFGFEVVEEIPGRAAFLRAAGSENHHDLGLFALGPGRTGSASRPGRAVSPGLGGRAGSSSWPRRPHTPGLGALVGASDHGSSKSLYGKDPDGNEFEVMWAAPPEPNGTRADSRRPSHSTGTRTGPIRDATPEPPTWRRPRRRQRSPRPRWSCCATGDAGLETLMLRRNSKLEFAGGMWVWPGGRIDPATTPTKRPRTCWWPPAEPRRARPLEEAGLTIERERPGLVLALDATVRSAPSGSQPGSSRARAPGGW